MLTAAGYNFCDILPASISGRVITTTTQDCEADQPAARRGRDDPVARNPQGQVSDRQPPTRPEDYSFTNLSPLVVYTVHEVQPVGIYENDADPGSVGTAVGNDTIATINSSSGTQAVNYDFCDLAAGQELRRERNLTRGLRA